jgi:hypothetical protein
MVFKVTQNYDFYTEFFSDCFILFGKKIKKEAKTEQEHEDRGPWVMMCCFIGQTFVTVRLSLNVILGVKICTLDRTELVSGEMSVTVCIAVRRAEIMGKMIQE